ncbi:nucleolar protein 58 [Toxorhynchites rutilus septentrionalis]|uniref:nucleolar protein 58 n=1 Tax=Toxorhynchites rutilus septentrionalis TaxID=329112 RepID=UPI0024786F8C|nr:nucleolar protein 58 [Toxorhynchites rutilus septentrionalis]
MFVLYETPAGYAIFKLLDDTKLKEVDNLYLEFESPEQANKIVKLKHFEKFADTTEALSAATAAVEGKVSKPLKKTLKKLVSDDVQQQLLVADAKLGSAIKDKLALQCVSNSAVQELMRCIRSQSESLLSGLPKKEMTAMALGLAHSLSRYKLKFSPDKIDTMIVQAQSLLDDLDKELNNYMMRAREWYGWHFPELVKILTDNIAFIKTIKLVGTRDNMATTDLSDILPEELEEKVKEAAEISMGTEISEEDIINIQNLCDEILSISEYRTHLYDYLKTRMMAMAPNLTVLVGETIGARLIAHAGSLVNLAKHPASTLQILGAEKALFRALKTKKDTPKYGLIFHANLIGSASTKNKGKISRSLAAKASLATRVDAFGEDVTMELGIEHRAKLEMRLRLLEEGNLTKLSGTGKAKAKLEKYHAKSEVRVFKSEDSTLPLGKKRKLSEGVKIEEIEVKEEIEEPPPTQGESSKKKKKQKSLVEESEEITQTSKKIKTEDEQTTLEEEPQTEKKKKKKKKRDSAAVQEEEVPVSEDVTFEQDPEEPPKSEKKKKKKKIKEESSDS